MSGINGQYHSETVTTDQEDFDLSAYFNTKFGKNISIKKITIIPDTDIGVRINKLVDSSGNAVYSKLYQDENLKHKMSLDARDCLISNILIEDDATDVFVAMIY